MALDLLNLGNDGFYLTLALDQAKSRRGFCAPNPSVGAVVVKDNQVIGKGFHLVAGAPHAEVVALKKLEAEAEGSTVYVSLEPCCHTGKTPPCTELLIRKKVARVVYGYRDPNPLVAGKGEARLKEAGIQVDYISLPDISEFYRSYAFWTKTQRPYVTAKLALSIDGKIAGPGGRPVKITSQELDTFTHENRKHSDAILTTVKTIIADDPKLNVRFNGDILRKPLYILDSRLDLPLNANVFATSESLHVFHSANASLERQEKLKRCGVKLSPLADSPSGSNLDEMISLIGKEGIHDLWVEAGGTLFAELINQRLVQRAYLYSVAKALGPNAYPAFPKAQPEFSTATFAEWHPFKGQVCLELRW